MKKLNFNFLFLSNKEKILFRNKHSVPDIPKTLVYVKKRLTYIRSDSIKFYLEDVSITHLVQVLQDLGQTRHGFPFAMFKSQDKSRLCMNLQETIELCQKYLNLDNRFEVKEYIVSSSESVQIIRVYIAGLNVSARILQNHVHFDSHLPNNEKFMLNLHSVSSNMMLSTSISGLKQRAMSLHYWISACLEKKIILKRLALDFIKCEGRFFFISSHSCALGDSVSQKASTINSPSVISPQERTMLSSKTSKQLSLRKSIRDVEKKSFRAESSNEGPGKNVEFSERIQRRMTYEKIKDTEEIEFAHRGSTLTVRVKDEAKKTSAFALRTLYTTLEENMKKVERDALSDPDIIHEFKEFLNGRKPEEKNLGYMKNLLFPSINSTSKINL